ncbi:MAG: molybdopterin-dependent oxidoreductase [Melioribacteraceae bacterium]|nr:molybdopterin-dependent oxidoreductase [Melioribacteraceae bacterium]
MPIYTTACPRNCYSTCSFKVLVKDDKIRSIEPHGENKAAGEGVCLKGLSYVERVYSKDRILKPLRRNRVSNEFEEISWNDAIEIIAFKLNEIREKHSQKSVLYYSASGTKGLLNGVGSSFWKMYGGCTTTYGDLCWSAGLEATRLTLGDNKHNAPWDLENAKLIIMWGKNPAETNVHQIKHIDNAIENGARLVVIDTRRTESAEKADMIIQPRPGTDGALALAAANILIHNDWIDKEFIANNVFGFEELKNSIKDYSVEKASEITGVPEGQIYKLAELIGTIKPMTINAGYGMQRYTNSGQTMRAILSLISLTGNIGKPGAGWMFANLQTGIFDSVKDPIASYPPKNADGIFRVSIPTTQLGKGIIEQTDPPIKMIWVERGNPIPQNPNTNKVIEAFRSSEFNVVIDQFLTDTAMEADIVLPAKSMFEQSDIIGAYWHPYIQLRQKIIDPPGEVKPETEIYYLLAKEMGFPDSEIGENLPFPSDETIEKFLAKKLEPFPELSLERLKENPVIAPGHEEIAFADLKFPTPSGKIELYSEEANSRWNVDSLPTYNEPVESAKSSKFSLSLMTPNTKNRIHSQFNNLELIKQISAKPVISINPEDAKRRNIKNGDLVKVFNDRGNLTIEAGLTFSIKAGAVSITNGWWLKDGATVNILSADRETDMGHGAAFHDNMVEVEKV